MALDGIFLSKINHELKDIIGARVDKVTQPSREEIIIFLRSKGGNVKLLMSAGANNPRIHLTTVAVENPKQPPMFCMLLRKYLGSGKIGDIRQLELDRILHIDIETTNELGDNVIITIAVEIMGRHSNIIIIDQNGKVIDSIKRIDLEMSSVRQVLPGIAYTLPPIQDKIDILKSSSNEIISKLEKFKDLELSNAFVKLLQGVSPLLGRELAYFISKQETTFANLSEYHKTRLEFCMKSFCEDVQNFSGTPIMILDHSGKPCDYCVMPVYQYENARITKEYESFSGLLDAFYAQRDMQDRMRQRSKDLLSLLVNISDRITRKLVSQREELKTCAEREIYKIYGDILNANLYTIKKGDVDVELENFYDNTTVKITLNPQLTPAQNAQKQYNEYRKADTTEKMLNQLIVQAENELIYIDSVFDSLVRASSDAELTAIRKELAMGGYLKTKGYKQKKEEKLSPLKYISSDGFVILTGRNNFQNDQLTLKESKNYDMWLHVQKIPGSHTIIISEGKQVPNTTLEEAAIIAAYNSKARDSGKIAVDYTLIKNVKKPNGAKPGMVIYETYQTAIVTPNAGLAKSLQVK